MNTCGDITQTQVKRTICVEDCLHMWGSVGTTEPAEIFHLIECVSYNYRMLLLTHSHHFNKWMVVQRTK